MRLWRFAAACGLVLFATMVTGADAKLPHAVLIIDSAQGPKRFVVEIAADEPSRMQGLMFRKWLAPDSGMLFEFPDDHFRAFWMKNTILSLDMLFIRADGTISSIAANTTPYSEAEILSREPVRAVLEINGGRSATLGIVAGRKVHHALFGDPLPGQ
jgi:uncharacterized membrane protein (UPF0127 family)